MASLKKTRKQKARDFSRNGHLTPYLASQVLDKSLSTIYKYISEGKLQATKEGSEGSRHHLFITLESLENHIDEYTENDEPLLITLELLENPFDRPGCSG